MFSKENSRRVVLFGLIAASIYLFSNSSAVNPDSVGYFSYLPSLWFDGDLQLLDEFRLLRIQAPLAMTSHGYALTSWPIGSAVLWAPFYACAWLLGAHDSSEIGHGCGGWFWRFVNHGTFTYVLLSLWLYMRIAKRTGPAAGAALNSGLLALLGMPLAFYALLIPSTSHGTSAFTNTLVVAATLGTLESSACAWRWLLVGMVCGFSATVRLQNILFLLFPIADWVRHRDEGRPDKSGLAWLFAGCALGLSPQLLTAWIFNGAPWNQPSAFNLAWHHFSLLRILFSSYHGLLFWTPIFFLGLAGLCASARQGSWISRALLVIVVSDLFVDSLCAAWWEGHSFGLRQTCGLWVAIAWGVTAWIDWVKTRGGWWRVAGMPLALACALWTLGLLFHSVAGLELERYVSPFEILRFESSWAHGLASFTRWVWRASHPGLGLWAVLAAMTGLAYLSAALFLKKLRPENLRIIALALLAALCAVDVVLIRAHLQQAPFLLEPGEQAVSLSAYKRFFLEGAFLNPYR